MREIWWRSLVNEVFELDRTLGDLRASALCDDHERD